VAAFIAAQRAEFAVPHAVCCRALGVSPAWFYKWRDGDATLRRARRRALADLVTTLFVTHRGRYGSPRITADLRELGWRVSQNTVAVLMAEQQLVARPKRRRKATTHPGRGRWRAPDLVGRVFHADRPDQRWFGDGTEIPTGEGKLFLASVLDIHSRRILGFALGEHHDAALAYSVLVMAVAVRGGDVDGVVFHTDGGGEYVAGAFRTACTRLGISQSMGRPGSALDNAAIESWHSTLTFELLHLEQFVTRSQARRAVSAWIDEYNRDRRHSALGMRSPIGFELDPAVPAAASLPPSSPASRPSPPGGLRPALTPAPDDGRTRPREHSEGRSAEQDPPNRSLYGFGGLPSQVLGLSSSGVEDVCPGSVFVVWGLGLEAAVQDADEPVGELAQGGLVSDVSAAELLVVGAGSG
jgi:putative transposase